VASTAAGQLQRHHLPRLALRLRVFVTHWRLDAELARGVDPQSTAARELRAAQLQRLRYRRRLAAALDQRLMAALRGPMWSSAVPVARGQVAEASENLFALAQILRAPDSVDPQGVALVKQLLSDGSSALYVGSFPGALEHQTQAALNCLVGQPWVTGQAEPLSVSMA
jgi:hypothetical protein